jgi:hypothetical protein
MMFYECKELIDLLLKIYVIVLFRGIITLPFVSVKIKPVISLISVAPDTFINTYIAVNGFTVHHSVIQFIQNRKIQAYVIYVIVFILAIFISTILNL